MPPEHWAAILFDLDGTLADTVDLILTCFRHTMRTHLGRVPPDEEWLCGMGTPLRRQLAAFARSPAEVDAMADTYRALQRRIHDERVRPYPQVPELLEALKGGGVPLALVTSRRPEMTRRTLECCGLAQYFEILVTPDDVVNAKPHPEPVLTALSRLGSPPPSRVLLVGDSTHDIEAGRAAGVRTAGVLWGPFSRETLAAAGPDYLVSRPLQLLQLEP